MSETEDDVTDGTGVERGESPPDSINEFAVVGEFGFKRIEGPFRVEKEGTVWAIDIHDADAHPAIGTLNTNTGDAAALVVDGEIQGGGVIVDVLDDLGTADRRVLVDQYAMGDPYADEEAVTDGGQEPQRSGAWLGELEGIGVRDPGPDADGPIVEFHGDEGMAAIEVASEEVVDQLSHTAAEVQLALDEQEEA